MKIYLASSWKNAEQVLKMKLALSGSGYEEVDAFCDTEADRFVFSFNDLPSVENHNAKSILHEPQVRRAFEEDKKWLDWADVCILILPAGKSAHLEAGYTKGSGKKLIIYQDEFPFGDFDVMYGFADVVTDDMGALIAWLDDWS